MAEPKISISFRGRRLEFRLAEHGSQQTVREAKLALITAMSANDDDDETLQPADIKLLWKGKVLAPEEMLLRHFLGDISSTREQTYRIVGMGVSKAEARRLQSEEERLVLKTARLVKDDLSAEGRQKSQHRSAMGRRLMWEQQQREARRRISSKKYRFGSIETLPDLPNESQARSILEGLANDPGVLACMAKHQWNVGSLAELYPEGKVGESPVCVMGLNQSKGRKILLRLRTDDLQGFRKPLAIRKVLFHELAHNVHSDHDDQFFLLMRQIERECQTLDWTQGAGIATKEQDFVSSFTAGTFRLGGDRDADTQRTKLSARELAARAAELRTTAEESEIERNCGCTKQQDSSNEGDEVGDGRMDANERASKDMR